MFSTSNDMRKDPFSALKHDKDVSDNKTARILDVSPRLAFDASKVAADVANSVY